MSPAGEGVLAMKTGERPVFTVMAYICFALLILGLTLFMSKSAKHVVIQMGGKTTSVYTFAPTVGDILREYGIRGDIGLKKSPAELREGETVGFYSVSADVGAALKDGMKITVYRDQIKKTVEKETIAPPVQREWDIFLPPGKERVISAGKDGLRENTYLIRFRDGKAVSKKKVGSRIVNQPEPKKIATGSYEAVSRQGNFRVGKPLKFVATAYTYTGYRTATGAQPRQGIVAVDPRVIPLGTRLYVEGYGYAVAADTGGLIKGRRIDVFLEDESKVPIWGRRTVDVYILGK